MPHHTWWKKPPFHAALNTSRCGERWCRLLPRMRAPGISALISLMQQDAIHILRARWWWARHSTHYWELMHGRWWLHCHIFLICWIFQHYGCRNCFSAFRHRKARMPLEISKYATHRGLRPFYLPPHSLSFCLAFCHSPCTAELLFDDILSNGLLYDRRTSRQRALSRKSHAFYSHLSILVITTDGLHFANTTLIKRYKVLDVTSCRANTPLSFLPKARFTKSEEIIWWCCVREMAIGYLLLRSATPFVNYHAHASSALYHLIATVVITHHFYPLGNLISKVPFRFFDDANITKMAYLPPTYTGQFSMPLWRIFIYSVNSGHAWHSTKASNFDIWFNDGWRVFTCHTDIDADDTSR